MGILELHLSNQFFLWKPQRPFEIIQAPAQFAADASGQQSGDLIRLDTIDKLALESVSPAIRHRLAILAVHDDLAVLDGIAAIRNAVRAAVCRRIDHDNHFFQFRYNSGVLLGSDHD
jgi:hypothetical protein